MYLKFWKYLLTSNVATVFELVFFIIFESLFSKLGTISIFVATICARAISSSVGYILNRYISFQSKLNPGREMVRYSIVFVCQMAASGILVSLLSVIPIPTVIVKVIIDTILFLSSIIFKKMGICREIRKTSCFGMSLNCVPGMA